MTKRRVFVYKFFLIFIIFTLFSCSLSDQDTSNKEIIPKEYEGLCKDGPKGSKNRKIDLSKDIQYYEAEENDARYYYVNKNSDSDYHWIDLMIANGRFVALKDYSYIQWYLCEESIITSPSRAIPNLFSQYENFTLSVYNLVDKGKVKSIDVDKIVNENYKDYQIYGGQGYTQVIEREGKYYMPVRLSVKPKKLELGKKLDVSVLLIDVETGEHKLSETPYTDFVKSYLAFNDRDYYAIIGRAWGEEPYYNLGSANGIPLEVVYPESWRNTELNNTLKITTNVEKLPKNNERLYSMFPMLDELRQEAIDSGTSHDLIVELNVNDFPTWQDVLKLFMEDGKEITFDKWQYKSETEYYENRLYDDFQTEFEKFKEDMKINGFDVENK